MDEEDGRLGPRPGHIIGSGILDPARLQPLMNVTGSVARQIGPTDVLPDASTKSCAIPRILRYRMPHVSILTGVPSDGFSSLGWLRPGSNLRTCKDLIQNEEKQ